MPTSLEFPSAAELHRVMAEFPTIGTATTIRPLVNEAGFSGALLWQIESGLGKWALRRWPAGTARIRIEEIHRVLFHVVREGLIVVAAPIKSASGESVLEAGGHLWELAPWMPGLADFHSRPSRRRLDSTMNTLAQFHLLSTATQPCPAVGVSTTIADRIALIRRWQSGDLVKLAAQAKFPEFAPLAALAQRVMRDYCRAESTVLTTLIAASKLQLPLCPVIRDIWHDHVLFVDEAVSGLIDFDAMRVDTVACDLARLLPSFLGPTSTPFGVGLDLYAMTRRLSDDERQAFAALVDSAALLTSMNWLRWLVLERRQFAQPEKVLARLREAASQLHQLNCR